MKFPTTVTYLITVLLFLAIDSGIAQNIYSKDKWEERDKWQNVPRIFESMGIATGDVVADIGCHQGYMAIKFAKAVGNRGKVYAVDINQSRLNVLDKLLDEKEINNVKTVLGDYDNPNLPANSLDFAFIMDTYHEMDDYMDILGHVKSALKPEGKIVILEPVHRDRRGMQRSDQENKHEIDMKYVIEDLKKAGFLILKQIDPYLQRKQNKNDELWLLIARPKDQS